MKNWQWSLFLIYITVLTACSTASNITKGNYVGVYENPKNPMNRFVIDFKNELYRLKYYDPEQEWEGVGYEREGKIIAVLRPIEEGDEGRFLSISFPGDTQLFVVVRNLEGGYLSDDYFKKIQ